MASITAEIPPSRRAVIGRAKREEIAALLVAQPSASDSEIAEIAGVSRTVVQRIRIKITQTDEDTNEYGRRLAKRLPMSKRVALWASLAKGEVDPRLAFAQKAALQRVEELIGHVTAKEKRESEAIQTPGPIIQINLAPGSAATMAAPVNPQPVVVEAKGNELPSYVKPASD